MTIQHILLLTYIVNIVILCTATYCTQYCQIWLMYCYVLLRIASILLVLLLALPVLLLYCRNIFLKKCILIAILVDPSPDSLNDNENAHNAHT